MTAFLLKRGTTTTTRYLGYTVEVGQTCFTVYAPDGRRIFGPQRASFSTVRAFIRGYRRPSSC